MIVADTNLTLYLVVRSPLTAEAVAVYQKDSEWIAPPLWRSEFRNALAFYMRRGLLALDDAIAKMQAADSIVRSREFEVFSSQVLRLAASSGCSAYDCEFVALAQDLAVPLVTSDREVLAKFKNTAISPCAFCAP